MPESPTESARAQGAPPEPPIGEPIYDAPQPDESSDGSGEHVVIIPQTAGSAGAAHKES